MAGFDPIATWPALVRAYQEVRTESEEALKRNGISSLEEYDILLELRRAVKPLTLSALNRRTLLRQYQLSRMVDRLERKGLVCRTVASDDARARLVSLTKEGRQVQKRAGKAYLAVLEQRLASRIDREDLETLAKQLNLIAEP